MAGVNVRGHKCSALSAHLLLAAVHLWPRLTGHGLLSSARTTPTCHRRPSHSRCCWPSALPPPRYHQTVTLVGCLSSIVFAHAGRAGLYVAVISVSTDTVDVHRTRNAVVVALYSCVVVPIVLVISCSYFRSLFTLSARRLICVFASTSLSTPSMSHCAAVSSCSTDVQQYLRSITPSPSSPRYCVHRAS